MIFGMIVKVRIHLSIRIECDILGYLLRTFSIKLLRRPSGIFFDSYLTVICILPWFNEGSALDNICPVHRKCVLWMVIRRICRLWYTLIYLPYNISENSAVFYQGALSTTKSALRKSKTSPRRIRMISEVPAFRMAQPKQLDDGCSDSLHRNSGESNDFACLLFEPENRPESLSIVNRDSSKNMTQPTLLNLRGFKLLETTSHF